MIKVRKTLIEWAEILGMPFLKESDSELYPTEFITELGYINESYCRSVYRTVFKSVDIEFNLDLVGVAVELGELEELKRLVRESRAKAITMTLSQLYSIKSIKSGHPRDINQVSSQAGIMSVERVGDNEIEVVIKNPALFFNHIITKMKFDCCDYLNEKYQHIDSLSLPFVEKYLQYALEVFEKNIIKPHQITKAHILLRNSAPKVKSQYLALVRDLDNDDIGERIFSQSEIFEQFDEEFDINEFMKIASEAFKRNPAELKKIYLGYLESVERVNKTRVA